MRYFCLRKHGSNSPYNKNSSNKIIKKQLFYFELLSNVFLDDSNSLKEALGEGIDC